MGTPRTAHASDDELTKGEEALANAAELIAKAADADLDADFGDYDKAAAASAEPDEDEEGAPDDATDAALEGDDLEGEPDEDDDEDDEEGEGDEPAAEGDGMPFAKADEPGAEVTVDALPLLQSIDAHFAAFREHLATIHAQNRALLSIAKAQQASIGHFAKAQDAISGLPRTPKSQQRVNVATAAPTPARDINTLFAKASEHVSDPARFGMVEHYYNRKDAEGMIGSLLPDERAKVLAD